MRGLVAIWLVLLAAAPLVAAQQQAPGAGPSFLVYHAPGGRAPDPLASALVEMPAADRLPATFFDRAERADAAPENAPESAPAHFREMERRLSSRETMGAPSLSLAAEAREGALRASVRSGANGTIHLVLFEHGAPLAGVPQPYVARFSTDPENVTADSPRSLEVRLDPAWDLARLGAVAILREGDLVVQSATWLSGAGGESRQGAKGVLVEHVTASWCDPCRPADDAIALLALQRGAAPALGAGDVRYFQAPSWMFYAGLALGAIGAIAITRRPRA